MNKTFLHVVIIYTLSTCPWCAKAKALLNQKNVTYQEIVVDDFTIEEKAKVGNTSEGKVTFPHILIDGQSVGGYTDLEKLETQGKLDELLKNSK
ncbi:glutaredoxin domain-containing protein [Candidatus Tisiphia endosymbiont of Nemotelus uliginosus]|uniref:glutaredoxin domain-containing protein n=1 Tax=Candidatus Tisiphia endosymbiont of Nemotelus uliginosus TaxID=3077926 RepID=UPI0035C9117C